MWKVNNLSKRTAKTNKIIPWHKWKLWVVPRRKVGVAWRNTRSLWWEEGARASVIRYGLSIIWGWGSGHIQQYSGDIFGSMFRGSYRGWNGSATYKAKPFNLLCYLSDQYWWDLNKYKDEKLYLWNSIILLNSDKKIHSGVCLSTNFKIIHGEGKIVPWVTI